MTDQQQPRKTIKLKPISKAPGSSIGATASGPISVAPESAQTIQAESFGDAPTVKLSPQSIISPAPVPVVPSESADQDQPMLESTHTGTQPLKKMPAAQTVPGTLIPQGFGNKMSLQGGSTPVGQTMPNIPAATIIAPMAQEDESTQKIATAAKAVAKPQQQTIKLRPSTTPAPSAEAAPAMPGAQTIKLGPSSAASTATPAPTGATIKLVPTPAPVSAPASAPETETAAIKTSSPTIKLSPTQHTPAPAEVKPSAPTIKLTAGSQTTRAEAAPQVSPGAQTIQLSPEAQAAASEEAHPQKTKLVIKKPEAASGMGEMHEGQLSPGGEPVMETEKSEEPSMIFTLVAVFTLLVAGYLFFLSAAQYANHWMGKSIPLPGISSTK